MTTAEVDQKILDHLNQKCPNFKCPACGAFSWQAGDGVALTCIDLPVSGPGPITPTKFSSGVVIACNNCGHLEFFSAKAIGV